MDPKKTFQIYLLRKIPYLTNGLLGLLFACGLIFFLAYGFLSSDDASPEMKTFYLMNTPTFFFRTFLGVGFFGILCFILFRLSWAKDSGSLTIDEDSFLISTKSGPRTINFDLIRSIESTDTHTWRGNPAKRFGIRVIMKSDEKIRIKLRHRDEILNFSEALLQIDRLDISIGQGVLFD